MKPIKVRILNQEEAAYIAGIVDGEGTITLTRRNKGQNRRLSLVVSNNEVKLLKWIKRIVGAGQITTKRFNPNNRFNACAYQINNSQAYELVTQLAPYLRSYKRLRAKLVVKYYRKLTPRNGKYTAGLLKQREKFIKSFFEIKNYSSRVFDFTNI